MLNSDGLNHTGKMEGESKSRVPVLTPKQGTNEVDISHVGLDAEWLIQFPEVIATTDIMSFYPIGEKGLPPESPKSGKPIEWRSTGNGQIGYDWTPSKEMVGRVVTRLHGDFPIIPCCSLSTRMQVSEDRIDLSIEITNLTSEPLLDVFCDGGCFQHRSERFIDLDYSRTFIKTAEGLTRLSDTDRSAEIRAKYMFHPEWFDNHFHANWEWFWGRSEVRPTSTLIASKASQGGGTVGIGFDKALCLQQNSDAHRCMHSGPFFGTLEPGLPVMRRGVILFGGDIEELFERFEALDYRPW